MEINGTVGDTRVHRSRVVGMREMKYNGTSRIVQERRCSKYSWFGSISRIRHFFKFVCPIGRNIMSSGYVSDEGECKEGRRVCIDGQWGL